MRPDPVSPVGIGTPLFLCLPSCVSAGHWWWQTSCVMTGTELWSQVDADLYEVLHLTPCASEDQIQHAWRRSARSTHPDTGGDGSSFRDAHVAYLVLSDPTQRARYDRTRSASGSAVSSETPFVLPPDPDLSVVGAPPESRVLLALLAILLAAVGLSYVWPGLTIVIGFAVGGFVLTRYVRHWRRRTSRR